MVSQPATYQTLALKDQGAATPTLESLTCPIQPGSTYTSPADILLAGGFPSLYTETDIPLSPTLQLNGDLGSFSNKRLTAIAEAERERYHRVSFPSKIVESENLVCVLGDSAEKILTFQDTYGGILDIEPRLLNGYHLDLLTITDLSIDTDQRDIRLNYSVHSPIRKQQCTYCGECGAACPENCLDENLSIDFNRCTFCQECEKSCPHDLIDLHSMENRSLQVPTLIIIGDAQLDLDTTHQGIFKESQLPDYFKSIGSYRIDEVVTVDPAICQYSGRLDMGCSLCFDNCPHNAIEKNKNGIVVDPHGCMECGNCISICPTGSIQYERFPDQLFSNYFRNFELPGSSTVVLGEEKTLSAFWWQNRSKTFEQLFFLEYPKLSSLSCMHLLFLFAHGASRIIILQPGNSQATSLLNHQITTANAVIDSLFAGEQRIVETSLQTLNEELFSPQVHPLKGYFSNLNLVDRRHYLISILDFLVQQSGKTITFEDNELIGFGTLSIDEKKCTQCLACLNDCKIGALSADEQNMTLLHLGALCVGCSICVRICPEQALSVTGQVTLAPPFFQQQPIASAEPMHCLECGKVFGTRKSYERVLEILSSKNIHSDIDGLYECCDECRVIKMYEHAELQKNE